MNIFYISSDPVEAAKQLLDLHMKMALESAQILFTVLYLLQPALLDEYNLGTPYKPTHTGNALTKWACATPHNFDWLCAHGIAICEEKERRYHKPHACAPMIQWLRENAPFAEQGDYKLHTPPPLHIDDRLRGIEDPTDAHRANYHIKAAQFGSYINRRPPKWLRVAVPCWTKSSRQAKKQLVQQSDAPRWRQLGDVLSAYGIDNSDAIVKKQRKRKRTTQNKSNKKRAIGAE